ncbi:MAG: efflux RND transporter permease subunit, partial [Planctomycetota bacterium]|jgi:predicted RND superfamily exporter protein
MGTQNTGTLMTAPDGNGSIILLAAQPYGPAQRLEYSNRIMHLVRDETNTVVETLPPALRKGVKVEYAGGYEVAMKYSKHVSSSLISTLITSLIGVLLLFGYCYRRYGVLLYVGIPLIMIVCWTVGAGWLLFGKLNMISCAFAAVLIGLGVDYAIHIYNRYVEERCSGNDVETSFINSLNYTGRGVFIGMLTTSMSFFALKVTRFSGLSQFGVLAGTGLALALPAMVFVLPALVVWRSKRGKGEHSRAMKSSSFFLPQISTITENHYKKIAFVGIALTVIAICYSLLGENKVIFDERLASLRPNNDRVFVLGREIAEKFAKKSPARLMLLVTGDSESDALNNADGLVPKLKKLKEEGLLREFELLTQIIPSPNQQMERKKILSAIDFDASIATLKSRLDREGLVEDEFKDSIDFLIKHRELAQNGEVILPTSFKGSPAWRLVKRLVGKHKTHVKVKYAHDFLKKNKGRSFVLALTPTSRDGIRYFAEKAPVTQPSLAYLEKLGITELALLEKNPQTREYTDIGSKSISELKSLINDDSNFCFKNNVKLPDGQFMLAPETPVTPELIDFLLQSDCRKFAYYDKGWTVLAYVYPPEKQLKDVEFSDEWVNTVRTRLGINPEDKDAKLFLTGSMLVAHDLASIVKEDFIKITIWVAAIAALVLVICYRNITRVILSLTPIIIALAYLIGIMSLFTIYFNFINVLVIPIIIGLGVDNGIHLVHRYYESKSSIKLVVMETGRAIVITNLTSMIGFGSLWAGSYKGLKSMGMLSVLGLTMSIVASLIILPSIMKIIGGKNEEASAEE